MHKKIKLKLSAATIGAVILISVGLLLRLWRLPELFHFTFDEEVFAFVGKRMWVNHHIPLIGGVTPLHVHVAPYFYWLSGIILGFFKLNPLGWGIAAVLISGITMVILYKMSARFFGIRVAIVALSLYVFSFYQNLFDRHYWGLMFDGLVSLVTVYSLFHIIDGKTKYLYLLALTVAYGIHADLSTLTLVILSVLVFAIYKPRVSFKTYFVAGTLFLLSFVPLVVFDLRHDLANSRGILQYIEEVNAGRKGNIDQTPLDTALFIPRVLGRLLYVSGDTDLAKQYSYCPYYSIGRLREVPLFGIFVTIIILAFGIWYSLTAKSVSSRIGLGIIILLLGSTMISTLVYEIIFRGDLFDHYLATLFPVFLILTAYVLINTLRSFRYLLVTVLIVFAVLNTYLLISAKHSFGFADKERAVKWAIATTGPEPFSLDVVGDCFRYNGYRYLFYLWGKEPVKSYVDTNFSHLFDHPPAFTHPHYLVVIANPDTTESESYWREYRRYHEKLLAKAQFGAIEVLIVNNSKLDFVGKF